ncbi:hypothetical protein CEXT_411141 [Caerostris extrusa]|uniref:DDE Tnp4 domain-containing protein n=1 Tax=Caerostris extrusa TaxID=172846 RepID=A0AAV4XUZ9_CAEEX|nr:hypothetical protein CEXT_411141 [Caerostris extrusa]
MAARFQIFQKPITASVETCKAIVAATVWHNFLKLADDAMPPLKRRYCLPDFSDTLSPEGDTILSLWRQEKCALKRAAREGQDHHVLDTGHAY